MGIVNINDDSFSGDGTLDPNGALAIAARMVAEGADFIDVGAESARTNREAISVEEEIRRLTPFLEAFPSLIASRHLRSVDDRQLWPPLLSVNTWRPDVIEAVLPLGVDLVNDISGLPDSRNAALCAKYGASLLIMHTVGLPKIPHTHQRWDDVLAAMEAFFEEKIALAEATGLPPEAIVLDPGIDFAKQCADNLAIYRHLQRFHRFGRPLLLPISRKTVIGDVLGIANPSDRDAGTVACLVRGARAGAQLFRVHNVSAAVQSLRTLEPLLCPPE
ncbi:MAG: dihydropteroate synthase [Verrucomicrobiae bacterium]|nr:dihydropteroate synthase [Verrucomicrobiae bacterium]